MPEVEISRLIRKLYWAMMKM